MRKGYQAIKESICYGVKLKVNDEWQSTTTDGKCNKSTLPLILSGIQRT